MTDHHQGGALLPHRAWAFTLLLLAAAYVSGLTTNPPKWEEPRRSLVAMEMIERGDYVVPRLLGELYRAKPPFQPWTIALVSGLDVRRAGATSARLVSLGAWLGILVMLWRLGIEGRRGRPHLLPPLIFATTATVVQFSRAGEIDLLFCFFVTAAWTAFETGRRHGARWAQWTLSQVMVALGFLTKGLAPLFFYPPVLFCTWMRRRSGIRFSIPAFLAGVVLALAVAAGWLWPYSRMAPSEELQSRWAYELWRLILGDGWLGFARHLATYPFLLLGVAAPWSLCVPLWGADGWSRLGRLWREDPFFMTATATVGWGVLVYLGIPGTDGRYLIPVLPFASVVLSRMIVGESVLRRRLAAIASSRKFWGITAFLFAVWVAIGGWNLAPDLRLRVGLAIGLGLIALALFARWSFRAHAFLTAPLALGLIYALALAGMWESRQVRRNRPYVETASAFAAVMQPELPVVCDCPGGHGRKIAVQLAGRFGRVPRRAGPEGKPFYAILHEKAPAPEGGERLVRGNRFDLWRVEPPDGP